MSEYGSDAIPALYPMDEAGQSLGSDLSLLGTLETNTTRLEAKAALLESKGMLPRMMQWDCRYQHYRLVDKGTGESREFDCKQWSCLKHGPRVAWRWRLRLGGVPWSHPTLAT